MKFTDVIHVIINGFKVGLYFLKIALLCRNMSG